MHSERNNRTDQGKDGLNGDLITTKSGLVLPLSTDPKVLLPQKEHLEIITPDKNAHTIPQLDNQPKQEVNQFLITYLHNPWSYIRLCLNGTENQKVVTVIDKYLEKTRNKIPNAEKYSDLELLEVTSLLPETLKSRPLFNDFQMFIGTAFEELIGNQETTFNLIAGVCQNIDIFCKLQLLDTQSLALNAPEFLDYFAELLEPALINNINPTQKELQIILDFIAYFAMNSKDASGVFLELISKNNSNHPLKHELQYQTFSVKKTDPTQHRIGLEIEGCASIALGKNLLSDMNLNLGVDGGETMPEIRRDGDHLHFDTSYRRDLFQFWSWARLVQLKGASLHITIDDPDSIYYDILKKLVGDNLDTLKTDSDKKAIEVRLHLSNYIIDKHDVAYLDYSQPYINEQYQIVELVELLLDFIYSQKLDLAKVQSLPYFWQKQVGVHLKQRGDFLLEDLNQKTITYQEFESWLESDSQISVSEMKKRLSGLETPLSLGQFLELIFEYKSYPFLAVYKYTRIFDQNKIDFDTLLKLGKKVSWDINHTLLLLTLLDRTISGSEAINLLNTINESLREKTKHGYLAFLFRELTPVLDSTESQIEVLLHLYRQVDWLDHSLLNLVIDFKPDWDFEQFILFAKTVNWNKDILNPIPKSFAEKFSFDQKVELAQNMDWDKDFVTEIFAVGKAELTFEQFKLIYEIIKFSNHAIEKLVFQAKEISNQHIELLLTPRYVEASDELREIRPPSIALASAIKGASLPIDEARKIKLCEQTDYNREVIKACFGDTISYEKCIEILDQLKTKLSTFNYNSYSVSEVIALLDEISMTQFIKLLEYVIQLENDTKTYNLTNKSITGRLLKVNVTDFDISKLFPYFEKGIFTERQIIKITENYAEQISTNYIDTLLEITALNRQVLFSLIEQNSKKITDYADIEKLMSKPTLAKDTGLLEYLLLKLETKLTLNQVNKILKLDIWKKYLVEPLVSQIDTVLDFKTLLILLEESDWHGEIGQEALKKMRPSFAFNKYYATQLFKHVPKEKKLLFFTLLSESNCNQPIPWMVLQ